MTSDEGCTPNEHVSFFFFGFITLTIGFERRPNDLGRKLIMFDCHPNGVKTVLSGVVQKQTFSKQFKRYD